ncbi:hypothetical protein [Mycobacterium sp. OTB74]|uniref:hypothetical protein n=1 Tax=Mycobacterium sp. OTB74 TaxID=1853452 RepID=UPI002474239B|nr:hypothetical protein [Mycobacterium sp. OTB74]MDH6242538.1 hypothetical protein [Mycobacterium sp. OTB74]
MRAGNQTLTFVAVTEGTGKSRYNKPTTVSTSTDVPGCRFRPLTADEKIDIGDVVTDPWKATCPPVPAVLAAKEGDQVVYGGVSYRVFGAVRVFPDRDGTPFKVTVLVKAIEG